MGIDKTSDLQRLIDEQAAVGGGTAVVPPGDYPCGTLFLRDNVTLRLEAGARILGIPDPNLYHDAREERKPYSHFQFFRALIWARGCHNCGISGQGVIDGQGHLFDGELSSEGEPPRPKLVWFDECRNVRIRDVRLQAGAAWTLHLSRCEDVRVENIRIRSHANVNNDGIDIDSCRDVVVHGCDVDAEDDAVCLKTLHDIPCQDVRVCACRLRSRCYAVRCGSESYANFRNVTVSDCVIHGNDRPALGFDICEGGSVENVTCSNLVMDNVEMVLWCQADYRPVMVLGKHKRFFMDDQPPIERFGTIRNLMVSNIIAHCTPGPAVILEGLSGNPLQNITLSNWQLFFDGKLPPREINEKTYRSRGSVRKNGPPAQPYMLEADPNWGKFGWGWASRLRNEWRLESIPDAAVLSLNTENLNLANIEIQSKSRPSELHVEIADS